MVDSGVNVPVTACPGCGLVLPGTGEQWDRRWTASVACHFLYGEALGYEHEHLVLLGRWHQLLVDTYAAQHAGEQAPAIATGFALIGLLLALEHSRPGIEVRDAHQMLANRYRNWPRFERPRAQAAMTIQDLVLSGTPDEYVTVLHRWAQSVWESWRGERPRVVALLNERLPRPGGWTDARWDAGGPGATPD